MFVDIHLYIRSYPPKFLLLLTIEIHFRPDSLVLILPQRMSANRSLSCASNGAINLSVAQAVAENAHSTVLTWVLSFGDAMESVPALHSCSCAPKWPNLAITCDRVVH